MPSPNFTDPQFVDAEGTGGLNAAFATVYGNVAGEFDATYALPGMVSPETVAITFSGMIATVIAPAPFGVITSGGAFAQAHGTQTNADTHTYTVDFSPLVPASGTINSFLRITPTSILQNPVPIPGPPAGHPSFNPSYAPTIGYATQVESLAMDATLTTPNSSSTFELARVVLTPGQTSVTSFITAGWTRASLSNTLFPRALASGGAVAVADSQAILRMTSPFQTQTMPSAALCRCLVFNFSNGSTAGWTLVTSGSDQFLGYGSSVVIPASGAFSVYCNGAIWYPLGINQFFLAAQDIFWTGQNVFQDNAFFNDGIIVENTIQSVSGNITALTGNVLAHGDIQTTNGNISALVGGITAVLGNITTSSGSIFATKGSIVANNGAIIAGTSLVAAGNIFSQTGNVQSVSGAVLAGTTITAGSGISSTKGDISTAVGNIISAGSLQAGTSVFAPIVNAGSTMTAGSGINSTSGNIAANNGFLTASKGAFNSGNTSAAALLGDFITNFSTVNVGYTRVPDGTYDQTYATAVPGGGGLTTTLVTLPLAYPTAILDAFICFNGNTPPGAINPGSICIQPFSNSQVSVTSNYASAATLGVVIRTRGH